MPDGLHQVARFLAVGGALLLVAEYISTLLMHPWTFRSGLPIWRRELPAGSLPSLVDTESVTVKNVGPSEWIFRRKFSFFDSQSPFQVRGRITSGPQGTVVVGRQPFGGALLFLAWAVFIGPPIGPLAAVGIYAVSWLIDRARFDQAWRELLASGTPD